MNRNELGPTLSTGSLSRLRSIVRQLDKSGNLLDLARPEVADLLRTIDRENESHTVLVAERELERKGMRKI